MMTDMAGLMWPLVAVVLGLALGLLLGARRKSKQRHAEPPDSQIDLGSALPSGSGGAESNPNSTPQQRLLERLRSANLQLSAQMKSLAESNSRQAQEREQERQGDRLRQERELEELRQQHANELSHLMNTLVEQVDGLNKAHGEQMKSLETELERMRQESRRAGHSAPGPLAGGGSSTRPQAMGGPAPAQRDYSNTLPMGASVASRPERGR